MRLTPHQRTAIDHISGNLQLIACAGSGKTEVIAQRVVNLLRPTTDGGAGCLPANLIAFTFTEKAAAELKERIHTRCREQLGHMTGLAEMYVGTIHGLNRPEFRRHLGAIHYGIDGGVYEWQAVYG